MNSKAQNATGWRIILLDDNPYDVELIQKMLQDQLDCQVLAVNTRSEFVVALEREIPNLVISDSNLPSFSGLAALDLVQQRCPGVPFVFCSGNSSPQLKDEALARGATNWVSKDDLDLLVKVVKQISRETPG